LNNTRGRLSRTSAAGGNAITLHNYDPAGRIKDQWQCTPYNCNVEGRSPWNIHYNYNLAGEVTSWVNPVSHTFTNSITRAQRISQITSSLSDDSHPATLATLTYAPHGGVATLQNGSVDGGTQRLESYDYNNRLQPVRIRLGSSGTPDANSCEVYNYYPGVSNPPSNCEMPSQATSGNNGNVVGHYLKDNTSTPTPDVGHTLTSAYDTLSRLSGAEAKSLATPPATLWSQTYTIDRYGNMSCSGSGVCTYMESSASTNRLTKIGDTTIPANWYDGPGNLLQDGTGTGTYQYSWDAEGRLKSVTPNGGGSSLNFVYDAFGQRVEKVVGVGTYTEYAYDAAGQVIGTHNQSAWTQELIPHPQAPTPLAKYQDGVTRFLHLNRLGSTTFLSNQGGGVTQKLLFYPWGATWTTGGTVNDNRFASMRIRDEETTLDPTLYRNYSSRLGRWLTPDMMKGDVEDPQAQNLYPYAGNTPGSTIDAGALVRYSSPGTSACAGCSCPTQAGFSPSAMPPGQPFVSSDSCSAGFGCTASAPLNVLSEMALGEGSSSQVFDGCYGQNCMMARHPWWYSNFRNAICTGCQSCCRREARKFLQICLRWCWFFTPVVPQHYFGVCPSACFVFTGMDYAYCDLFDWLCRRYQQGAVVLCCYKPPFHF
jgi:RHS repeat-associated protein